MLLSSRPTHSAYDLNGSDDEGDDTPLSSSGQQQRQRLLNSTQTINTSSGRLDNAHRLAAENEEIGQGVLNSLVGQRIQLQGANETLEEADMSVNRASRTITKMIRTYVCNSRSIVTTLGRTDGLSLRNTALTDRGSQSESSSSFSLLSCTSRFAESIPRVCTDRSASTDVVLSSFGASSLERVSDFSN